MASRLFILGELKEVKRSESTRRRACATGTLVLEAAEVDSSQLSVCCQYAVGIPLLLPLQRPLHDVPNRVLGRLAPVQYRVHLLRNRHFDLMFATQSQQRSAGIHAPGPHAHIPHDFVEGTSFAKLDSHQALWAKRPPLW